jgi:hypothetical protein
MLTASSYELASAILLSFSNIKLTPNSLPGTVIHVSESGPELKKKFLSMPPKRILNLIPEQHFPLLRCKFSFRTSYGYTTVSAGKNVNMNDSFVKVKGESVVTL